MCVPAIAKGVEQIGIGAWYRIPGQNSSDLWNYGCSAATPVARVGQGQLHDVLDRMNSCGAVRDIVDVKAGVAEIFESSSIIDKETHKLLGSWKAESTAVTAGLLNCDYCFQR